MAITKEDIIKLSKLYKALILAGVILVFAGIFYYLFYSPTKSKLQSVTAQAKRLEQEVEKKRDIVRNKSKYEKEVKELEAKLVKSIAQLPSDKEIPALLTSITEQGKDSGLEFTYFKQEKNLRKNYYTEIPATVKVDGDYHSVAKFFYRISQMDRIVQFSKLKMTEAKRKDAKGTLEASFTATTYKYEPIQAKPPGGKGKKKKRR